jgi:predicted unusual protein kinase regulating ubiquinone biosynthesis (AarF/ABC1/UbiB family)
MGTRLEGADEERYRREVGDLVASAQAVGEPVNVGRIVLGLARLATETGVRPAPELTILGKALLHLDDVARSLDSDLDPNQTIRDHSQSILQRHMLKRLSPASVSASALEMWELAQQMPARLNSVLDTLAANKLEIKVNAFDESRLMSNLEKIANRIALGLVLAALIVGAALMMQVRTEFRIFGYPGLAMVLFMLAVACGFALVLSILFNDDWHVWRNRQR